MAGWMVTIRWCPTSTGCGGVAATRRPGAPPALQRWLYASWERPGGSGSSERDCGGGGGGGGITRGGDGGGRGRSFNHVLDAALGDAAGLSWVHTADRRSGDVDRCGKGNGRQMRRRRGCGCFGRNVVGWWGVWWCDGVASRRGGHCRCRGLRVGVCGSQWRWWRPPPPSGPTLVCRGRGGRQRERRWHPLPPLPLPSPPPLQWSRCVALDVGRCVWDSTFHHRFFLLACP